MSEWAMKRFWKAAEVKSTETGFAIELDGRAVRTPGKARLSVPSQDMAHRVADEWNAVDEVLDPTRMPWTRSANSAIDKVGVERAAVEDHLIAYAGTDLLSYRADGPDGLIARQREGWDPILDWIADRFEARLAVTQGLMPVAQNADVLARLKQPMASMSDFRITGFHDLVTLSGSYVLALAVAEDEVAPHDAWALSRIDETWQIEQWGEDEEAQEHAERKEIDFIHASEFFKSA